MNTDGIYTFIRPFASSDNVLSIIFPMSSSNMYSGRAIRMKPKAYRKFGVTIILVIKILRMCNRLALYALYLQGPDFQSKIFHAEMSFKYIETAREIEIPAIWGANKRVSMANKQAKTK